MIGQHKFNTTEDALNRLFQKLDRRGNTIPVQREDLWALLKDHQELSQKFTEANQ